MTMIDAATPHIDSVLRDDNDEPGDRHLVSWVVVGYYEPLGADDDSFVTVAGNGNNPIHLGLLEHGKALLLE